MDNSKINTQVGSPQADESNVGTAHIDAPKAGPPRAAPEETALDRVAKEEVPDTVLQRLLPELEALPQSELKQITLNINAAVATVLGKLRKLRALRPSIVATLPTFDLTGFDKMEEYAAALNAADGLYAEATAPLTELRELIEAATQLREILLSSAITLVKRGLLKPEAVEGLKGPVGHKDLAYDLNHLAGAFKRQWAAVSEKSAVTEEELAHAQRLQWRLLRLVGEREDNEQKANAAGELRTRAFTRFIQAWDDVRRAVSHLRWKADDAEDFAPSLYTRNGAKRRSTDVPPAVNTENAQTDTQPPANTTQSSGTAPTGNTVSNATSNQGLQQPASNAASPSGGPRTAKAVDPGDDPFLA